MDALLWQTTGRDRTRQLFEKFHAIHPEVYDLFKKFAADLLASGHRRYSARTIVERIRWHYAINPDRDGGFKINDHLCPHYARRLMAEDSRFARFFELRGEK